MGKAWHQAYEASLKLRKQRNDISYTHMKQKKGTRSEARVWNLKNNLQQDYISNRICNFPNCTTTWRPSVQLHESMRNIAHSKHNTKWFCFSFSNDEIESRATRHAKVALYHWATYSTTDFEHRCQNPALGEKDSLSKWCREYCILICRRMKVDPYLSPCKNSIQDASKILLQELKLLNFS